MSGPSNQSNGRVTTFYSYKGGTGRSMLLANVGWALASAGRRVLMVDWDLEAPGLHRYFAPFLIDPDLTDTDGLIDLVIDYASAAVEPRPDRGTDWYREYADIRKYAVSVDWQFPDGGSLTLVPAGRQGPTYATRTNTFNWQHFYENLGGYGFMDAVRENMSSGFSEVLIDSRTGVSDTSGISTVQMPDQLVACFTLNNQSIEGAAAVARSVLSQRADGFKVFPVPMRLDNSEAERLRERWLRARARFAELQHETSETGKAAYWDAMQVPYIPKFSYEEVLADVANEPDDPKNINLFTCVQAIADRVFGVQVAPSELTEELRQSLLRVYGGSEARDKARETALRSRAAEKRIEARVKEGVAAEKEQAEALRMELQVRRAHGTRHAFVLMPFGTKTRRDGSLVDFNRIYSDLIAPALQSAGLQAFRADQETRPGDIRTDLLQELVLADLVVVDLTVDDPGVWYELGVRHALRARGVVIVTGGPVPTAFDLYADRKLRYSVRDGTSDPTTLEDDRRRLAEVAKATMESWHGRTVSPVYSLMPALQEPDWRSLRINEAKEFWEQHERWVTRIETARRERRAGDILVLAEEAPIAAFRADAWFKAGEALRRAGRFDFALELLDRGLDVEPDRIGALREKGICLQRLAGAIGAPGHTFDRARAHYRDVLERFPNDRETLALAGRLEQDAWTSSWRQPGLTAEQMRDEAAYEDARLRAAIDSYSRAYRADLSHYYPGINALTLMHLYRHLTGDTRYDEESVELAGAVRFASARTTGETEQLWSKLTLADLEVLIGTPDTVWRAYKEAGFTNPGDWFALHWSRSQLQLFMDLGFRQENVAPAIEVLDRSLRRLATPEERPVPRKVLLFSGHMVDTPERPTPRFPADKVPIAASRIAAALADLDVGPEDLALCGAAAGGDLLFLEAARQRGVHCTVMLPFAEDEFVERSVLPSANGSEWRERFYATIRALEPSHSVRFMPDDLGPAPPGVDPYERCNLWRLSTALAGSSQVHLVTLWDGVGGDGPGGMAHLYTEVQVRGGRVVWIDVRGL